MRLSFGIGVVFIPFGVVFSTEYVVARSYGSQLSDVVAGAVAPFGFGANGVDSGPSLDEVPTAALDVSEDFDIEAIAEPGPGKQKQSSKHRPSPRVASDRGKPKGPSAIFVDSQAVLRIANSGQRPSGKPVTAQGQRPAGVQVFGASGMGIGVRDGDVITRVSGVAVTSAAQVIALVVAARGARRPMISAEVYRGQRKYILTVEQPYLPGAEPPPKGDAGVEHSE